MQNLRYALLISGLILLTGCGENKVSEFSSTNEVVFQTKDSVTIYGDLYLTNEKGPLILVFHQGGSNSRGEYKTIIPELNNNGFNVFGIDQRRGGQTHGSYNRTIARFDKNEYSYCDAYPDLEAALNYATNEIEHNGEIIVWGSSYSAALAIQLGARNPEAISGVLAFSPASGGPLQECNPNDYFGEISVPLMVLRPVQETEIESVQNQMFLATESGHRTYVSDPGAHGSSMLVADRAGGNVDSSWSAVFGFLNEVITTQ